MRIFKRIIILLNLPIIPFLYCIGFLISMYEICLKEGYKDAKKIVNNT